MKEVRQFLDAMAEARSLADVNIAAGSALPVVSKMVRRVVAIVAIAMLVTTAALAHSYTRLDHRLKRANEQHTVQIQKITTTTKKQQRVMVATIVKVTKQRERLADTISQLRSSSAQAPWQRSTEAGHAQNNVLVGAPADVPTASTATEISTTVTPESVLPAEPSATSEQPAEPAPTPPAAPPVVTSPPPPPASPPPPNPTPKPPPPPPPPPAAPSPPTVAGVQPPATGAEPPAEPVGEPADPEPTPDPEPPSAGLGVP
jgi:hypothetical protein